MDETEFKELKARLTEAVTFLSLTQMEELGFIIWVEKCERHFGGKGRDE